MNRRNILLMIATFTALFAVGVIVIITSQPKTTFDGESAWQDVEYQVKLGPRIPGSDAHSKMITWMKTELENYGWRVEVQDTSELGQPVQNVIARNGNNGPWIILCAHYDSRLVADHDADPALRTQPVPGANDGASGVAILLELARVLPKDLPLNIWLVFFDAEDQGNISGWDWILGSSAFVKSLTLKPDAVILLDMVGDANLQLLLERNSTQSLALEVWQAAEKIGYGKVFVTEPGPSLLDDHTPFLYAGIPAIDIIDFDYAYWHTTQDTPDKVSPASLKAVGDTLLEWLQIRAQGQ